MRFHQVAPKFRLSDRRHLKQNHSVPFRNIGAIKVFFKRKQGMVNIINILEIIMLTTQLYIKFELFTK